MELEDNEKAMLEEIRATVRFFSESMDTTGLSPIQVHQFAESLSKALVEAYRGRWYPTQPVRGQALRCLRLDTQFEYCDKLLYRAADAAGIAALWKRYLAPSTRHGLLTVWVDPGCVDLQWGSSEPRAIYRGPAAAPPVAYKVPLTMDRRLPVCTSPPPGVWVPSGLAPTHAAVHA